MIPRHISTVMNITGDIALTHTITEKEANERKCIILQIKNTFLKVETIPIKREILMYREYILNWIEHVIFSFLYVVILYIDLYFL